MSILNAFTFTPICWLIMKKKEKNERYGKNARDERLEKIRSLITHQSEDAAKVLKMWLNKAAEKNK
mgnify:FL=1